jgi:hypothetical protein
MVSRIARHQNYPNAMPLSNDALRKFEAAQVWHYYIAKKEFDAIPVLTQEVQGV